MAKVESLQSTTPNVRANPTAIYNGNPFEKTDENRAQSPPARGTIAANTPSGSTNSVSSPVQSPTPRHRIPPFHEVPSPSRSKPQPILSVEHVKGPRGVRMTLGQRLRQFHTVNRIAGSQTLDSQSDALDSPLATGESTDPTPSTPTVTKVKKGSTSSRGLNSPTVMSKKDMPLPSKSCSPAVNIHKKFKHSAASHERMIRTRNASAVDFSSKVSSKGNTDPMLHLKFAVDCPLPPGLVQDTTPLSSKFNPEIYRLYKVPDPRMSPEDRLRQFQRVSLSPRIKSDLMAKQAQVYVAIRMRPYTAAEKKDTRNKDACVFFDKTNNTVRVANNSNQFEFDSLFDCPPHESPAIGQERVYRTVGEPLVRHSLEGYNSCLFAYGQTGSGKTYSIAGDCDSKGIIPRLVEDLFNRVPSDSCVSFTYIEIYNDNIHNLLADSTTEMQNICYKIREHSVDGPYIPKLVPIVVENPQDLLSRWSMGNLRRQTAATVCNARSSRSHALLQITVQQRYFDEPDENDDDSLSEVSDGERLTSKINIVDLAGSERSNVSLGGDRLREGGYINKSLFTLGKVITELSHRGSNGRNHIPYRDSPLTFLLKESLGGNSRTFMLATISPSIDCVDETLSTLRYAAKAKRIVNSVRVNDDPKLVRNRLLEAEITRLLNLLAIHKIDPNSPLPSESTSSLQSASSVELPQSPVISPYETPEKTVNREDKSTSPLKVALKNEGSEPCVDVHAPSTFFSIEPYQSTLIRDMKRIIFEDDDQGVDDTPASSSGAVTAAGDKQKSSSGEKDSKKKEKKEKKDDKNSGTKKTDAKTSDDWGEGSLTDSVFVHNKDTTTRDAAPKDTADDWAQPAAGDVEKSSSNEKDSKKKKKKNDKNSGSKTAADAKPADDWAEKKSSDSVVVNGKDTAPQDPPADDWGQPATAVTSAAATAADDDWGQPANTVTSSAATAADDDWGQPAVASAAPTASTAADDWGQPAAAAADKPKSSSGDKDSKKKKKKNDKNTGKKAPDPKPTDDWGKTESTNSLSSNGKDTAPQDPPADDWGQPAAAATTADADSWGTSDPAPAASSAPEPDGW